MNKRIRQLRLPHALVAGGVALAVSACGGEPERTASDGTATGGDSAPVERAAGELQRGAWHERELEMLTILGDVANRPRPVPGRWRTSESGDAVPALDEAEVERLSKLQTLPYLQGYKRAPDETSVTVYDSSRAWRGVNAYTSGHAPEAFLMDMRGRVVHRWQLHIDDIWPEVPKTIHSEFWRRVHWYPNGDVLAIFEGIGLVKLNRHSRALWTVRNASHHQTHVARDGTIYVLTRRADILPRINDVDPVLVDYISVLTPEGEPLREVSLLEAFEKSDFTGVMKGMPEKGDIFHTNSLYIFEPPIPERVPAYQAGFALVSMLKLDAIAILDLEAGRVVWAHGGKGNALWAAQHDPTVLPNGNIMLFDNRGRGGKSKIVEFDPARRGVAWKYTGGEVVDLNSLTCGTSRRLPNGNILITESDNGRALEVTRQREVVWEFYNPHRAGEDGELIATLFELLRFERGYFTWLDAAN